MWSPGPAPGPASAAARPASRSTRPGRRRQTSRGHPEPHPVQVDVTRPAGQSRQVITVTSHLIAKDHRPPPSRAGCRSTAHMSRRARWARLFTVPGGTPISSGHLGYRPVLYVHEPPTSRSGCPPGRVPRLPPRVRPGTARSRRIRRCRPPRRQRAAAPSGGRGGAAVAPPAAGRSPTASRRARPSRPVAARAPPDRQERLLQHVLHVGRGQHGAQSGCQPRRVPREQLPQCGSSPPATAAISSSSSIASLLRSGGNRFTDAENYGNTIRGSVQAWHRHFLHQADRGGGTLAANLRNRRLLRSLSRCAPGGQV